MKSLTAISSAAEVQAAYGLLQRTLKKKAKSVTVTVGWPGDHGRFPVHWHAEQGVWALLRTEEPNRFWCAYGTENPLDHSSVDITCEVNPPKKGQNRRCAGLFVKDVKGSVYLAHTGRVGGGGIGIGQKGFLKFYRKPLEPVV